jgi:hypothetical protein
MTLILTIVRRRIITSQNKFRDIIKSNTEINVDEDTQEVNQEVNNEENQQQPIQEEQYATEEPIRDDLDLLLYNNRGNVF